MLVLFFCDNNFFSFIHGIIYTTKEPIKVHTIANINGLYVIILIPHSTLYALYKPNPNM